MQAAPWSRCAMWASGVRWVVSECSSVLLVAVTTAVTRWQLILCAAFGDPPPSFALGHRGAESPRAGSVDPQAFVERYASWMAAGPAGKLGDLAMARKRSSLPVEILLFLL